MYATPLLDLAPRSDASRRHVLQGAGLAALGALLSGCASTDPTASPSEAGTRTFEHALGTTEVPVSPTRIVTSSSTAITWQLATLGVLPIATSAAPLDDPTVYIRLSDPEAAAALDGIVSVGETELNLEAIASLRPDLIVGGDWDADLYDQLSGIAPTVLIRSDQPDDRYLSVQRQLAELTGTMDVLERLHDGYDARIAALQDRYGTESWSQLTWLVIDEVDATASPYLTNLTGAGPAHRVLTDLGAILAPSGADLAQGEPFAEVSRELVPGLDADVIFVAPPWGQLAQDPDTPVSQEILDLLATSTAGRLGQVYKVGLAWTNANVASFEAILDDIEAQLEDRGGDFFEVATD